MREKSGVDYEDVLRNTWQPFLTRPPTTGPYWVWARTRSLDGSTSCSPVMSSIPIVAMVLCEDVSSPRSKRSS